MPATTSATAARTISRRLIARLGGNWPYDTLLCQDGTDFQLITLDNAQKIRSWNARYAYPRLVYATMTMFFDEIMRQADPVADQDLRQGQ